MTHCLVRAMALVMASLFSALLLGREVRSPFLGRLLDPQSGMLGAKEHHGRVTSVYRILVPGLDFTEIEVCRYVFPGEQNYWLAAERGLLRYDPAMDLKARAESYRLLEKELFSPGGRGVITLR